MGATRQGELTHGGLGTTTSLVWPERGGAMGGLGHGDRAVCGEGTPVFLSTRGSVRLGSWLCTCYGMCGVVRSLKALLLPLPGGENTAAIMVNT